MTRREKPSIADRNAMGWMHIYPQGQWHMPAEIRGTTEALVSLRDALTRAIEGDGTAEAEAFASDGEGYGVQIRRVNVLNLLGPLPYDDGGMPPWGHQWADHRHEAWRAPPEPFDPECHRIVVYVDRDGSNPSIEPPPEITEETKEARGG